MTALQIILTVPFGVLFIYVALNLFETFRVILYKAQISDDDKRRLIRRFKISSIAMIVYFLFALFAFFINYLLTGGK
jgi:uncharacterized BrkB/YihY/UPF0761 family membrane protein